MSVLVFSQDKNKKSKKKISTTFSYTYPPKDSVNKTDDFYYVEDKSNPTFIEKREKYSIYQNGNVANQPLKPVWFQFYTY